jgi:RNA-directed DNA polymerase
VGATGRDTFQAKTIRNCEAVPAAPMDCPDNGTVSKMRRVVHSVIDKVYNWNNLLKASRKVVGNKGCAGVDGMNVTKWREKEEQHLRELRRRLMNDRYRSKPVLRRYIPKPGSAKQRPLGIPAVIDRVCQQAVCSPLQPVFEEYFHEDSHGFRPGRSTRTAAHRVEALRKQGYRTVVDLDIRDFFGQVDRDILMQLVGQVVKDRRVLGLIRGWLTAGVLEEGNIRYQISGTPQGGTVSPLLSNVYLTVLDNALTEKGYKFVRYADDVLILCQSGEEAVQALDHARAVLGRLKLELNEEKTLISSFDDGFDFLGFHFGRRGRSIAGKSLKAFYGNVREKTKRQQGDKAVKAVIEELNPVLRGWANYHSEGRNVGMFKKLDSWVRMRLRGYIHKCWVEYRWPGENKPTAEDFERMGLFSLRKVLRPETLQLSLFPVPQ